MWQPHSALTCFLFIIYLCSASSAARNAIVVQTANACLQARGENIRVGTSPSLRGDRVARHPTEDLQNDHTKMQDDLIQEVGHPPILPACQSSGKEVWEGGLDKGFLFCLYSYFCLGVNKLEFHCLNPDSRSCFIHPCN